MGQCIALDGYIGDGDELGKVDFLPVCGQRREMRQSQRKGFTVSQIMFFFSESNDWPAQGGPRRSVNIFVYRVMRKKLTVKLIVVFLS